MAGDKEIFMRQALEVINSTPNHPLAKLVNPETGNWWGRWPHIPEAEDHPTVQAGHRRSEWAGGDRIALQDSQSNQWEGRFVENGRKGFIERDAIEIGGVPVDPEAAKAWEKEGIIPPGSVANATPSAGWTLGDTLVAPPPDTYSGTHTESLPGGAGTTVITGDGASAVLMKGMSDFALLLGGGVSVMGTLALMDALRSLQNGQGDPADPSEDEPATQSPPQDPPPQDPPPKEPPPKAPPPKETPPKETPPKDPPKDPPPADPPAPKDQPPAAPPAASPPPGGDSSGGVPGASGGGAAAPEESNPVPSGATSSLSTGSTALLGFSYSPSDGSEVSDAPVDAPAESRLENGFVLPAPEPDFDPPVIDDGFAVPAPEPDFHTPATDDGFYLPGPDDPFENSGNGFDLPVPGDGFDLPAPNHDADAPMGSAWHDIDIDTAVPPAFDGAPR